MALGLKVTDLDGNPVSFGKASLRYFALSGIGFLVGLLAGLLNQKLGSLGSLYTLTSCIVVAFTEDKQGLHDMMAGTLVVRK